MEGEKSGIKILLFVEHGNGDPTHSMYLMEPPMEEQEEIDSEGFAVDSISPIKTIKKGGDCYFLDRCAMCRLGSCFYFFGGLTPAPYLYYLYARKDISELKLRVQVFNIDFPELGFHSVASLNAPKETPCVFSVKGLIYALGSSLRDCNLNKGKGSGIFERYYPDKDYWEVLPDPPKPFGERSDMNYIDSATVVRDRYVFVGNTIHQLYLVFDLDEQHRTSFPKSSQFSTRFPYGSLYVDHSLYYLTGLASWKPGTRFDIDVDSDDNEVRLVKRSPLPGVNKPSLLLKSMCLMPGNEQLMSTFTDLEGDTCFSLDYSQWRDIFHLGGHFYCYVSTSHLVDQLGVQKLYQPYCRGVWIKVFEEVVPDRNSYHQAPSFPDFSFFLLQNYHSLLQLFLFHPLLCFWLRSSLLGQGTFK